MSTAGGKSAKQILDTYAPKIAHKARKEGLSVNQLINKNVPKDEVLHTRRVESQVKQYRHEQRVSAGTTSFINVPWLKARNNKLLMSDEEREALFNKKSDTTTK